MDVQKRKIIVLSAIRNEKWIIEPFLKVVSGFADHVIILDQTDDKKSIKQIEYPENVIYIKNDHDELDEFYRQSILIKEARKIEKDAILISLDADEFFSEDFFKKEFQNKLHQLTPGYGMRFKMLNVINDFTQAWSVSMNPIIYADDGAEFTHQKKIHNFRLPIKLNRLILENDIFIYHFQFLDWKRMTSKHRWYQIIEKLEYKNKSPIEIYRIYNHMNCIPNKILIDLDVSDFTNYFDKTINLKKEINYKESDFYWWDEKVKYLIQQNGVKEFKKLDIWDNKILQDMKPKQSIIDKLIIKYLRKSQKYLYPTKTNLNRLIIRSLDKIIGQLW